MMPARCACDSAVQDLDADVRGLRRLERTDALRQRLERFAAHELHDHQQLVAVLMELVYGGDPGMVEPGQRDSLAAEAFQEIGVGDVGVEDLDRDLAVEGLVEPLVNDAHAAAAEPFENSIFTDSCANHGGPSLRVISRPV